ncbi:50S ribosomal protein L19 [bacterium]|nr:50S ribosomal protein L19 [bacterium]
MHPLIREVEASYLKTDRPYFRPGDTVRVHVRIVEGNKERVQPFEGLVISIKGSGLRETFTVRRMSFNVGMERIFQLHSPRIERIEVIRRGETRRAKLYYLRARRGRKARLTERRVSAAKLAAEASVSQKATLDHAALAEQQPAAPEAPQANAPEGAESTE